MIITEFYSKSTYSEDGQYLETSLRQLILVKIQAEGNLEDFLGDEQFKTDLITFVEKRIEQPARLQIQQQNTYTFGTLSVTYENFGTALMPMHATKNQFNQKYSVVKSEQSLAVGLVVAAIVGHTEVTMDSAFGDRMLDIGSMLEMELQERGDRQPYLLVDFQITNDIFEAELVQGDVNTGPCYDNTVFGEKAENLLNMGKFVFFSVGNAYFGIIKKEIQYIGGVRTTVYYLYDPHGIFANGAPIKAPNPKQRGKAVIIEIDNMNLLKDLVEKTLLKWKEYMKSERVALHAYTIERIVEGGERNPRSNVIALNGPHSFKNNPELTWSQRFKAAWERIGR